MGEVWMVRIMNYLPPMLVYYLMNDGNPFVSQCLGITAAWYSWPPQVVGDVCSLITQRVSAAIFSWMAWTVTPTFTSNCRWHPSTKRDKKQLSTTTGTKLILYVRICYLKYFWCYYGCYLSKVGEIWPRKLDKIKFPTTIIESLGERALAYMISNVNCCYRKTWSSLTLRSFFRFLNRLCWAGPWASVVWFLEESRDMIEQTLSVPFHLCILN